ncbi:MAG: PEGA domain-containing protein [Patescibacteria group bacterium]
MTTIAPQVNKKSNLTSYLIYVVTAIGIVLLIFFGSKLISNFNKITGKAALMAEVYNGDAKVYLDDTYLADTPFDSSAQEDTVEIKPGEHKVSVRNDTRNYDVTLNFLPSTQVVLNRDLGVSDVFSSGQNFWIEEADSGTVLSVIAEPNTAAVYIDSTRVGNAPYSSSDLTDGEYDLRVEAPGYESQTARIKVQKGYKLNVAIKLFPLPVPTKVELLPDSESLYNVAVNDNVVTADVNSWVKAVVYWNKTRGINLAGSGLNQDLVFDYFLTYDGSIYDKNGNKLDDLSKPDLLVATEKGAYLGRISDGTGLSEPAKSTLETLGGALSGSTRVEVLQTGVGWLRVRGAPGLGGVEVTKVNVGEVYEVLEVQNDWTKIKVSDLIEGWVSSQYVKEVTEEPEVADPAEAVTE